MKQNNVFNAPNNFAPAGSMKAGFPIRCSCRFRRTGSSTRARRCCATPSYFHVRPDMHEGSLHSFNVAFQRELPARFIARRRLRRQPRPRRADAVQRERRDRRRPAGQQRPAAVPAVRQVGGRDDVDRDEDRVQLAADEARSALLRRPAGDDVAYASGAAGATSTATATPTIATPADIERSWARTDQDRLHSLVESFLYQLPVGPDRKWLRDGPLQPRSSAAGR